MSRRLLVLAVVISAMATGAAHADTLVVDVGGGGDYVAIQPALDAAAEGDTVLVMPGNYTGADNTNLDFAGTNVELRSDGGNAVTTIDCEGNPDTRAFKFLEGDAGPSCVIEGFTFTDGNYSAGGLFYCWLSSPTVIDCVFSNSAGVYGGALYICESTASFTGCVFTGNTSQHGGGVQVELASPTFMDCEFTSNTSSGEAGGVDVIWEASPVFTGCTFSDNSAATHGGGIRCYDHSNPILTDCKFIGNAATLHGGGALCDSTSSPTLTDCLFQDNTGSIGGGMSCLGNSSPTVTNCTFSDNKKGGVYADSSSPTFEGCSFLDNSAQHGAGAYCYLSLSTFTDCVFSGNYASGGTSDGGGIVCDLAPIELVNCTFSDNGADAGGGSVHCWNADPVLTNCIIAFTTSGPALDCDEGTENPTLICCNLFGNAGGDWVGCIADQSGISNNLSADPLFCDRPVGDFTIDAASPCAAAHSGPCGLIGALDVGCDSPVEAASWGAIKSFYR